MIRLALYVAVAVFASSSITSFGVAGPLELKQNITAAHQTALKLVGGQGDPKALSEEIDSLCGKIDAEVSIVPGLEHVWEKFEANQDEKVLPAFDGRNPAGKEEARALAQGEQQKLYDQMMKVLP